MTKNNEPVIERRESDDRPPPAPPPPPTIRCTYKQQNDEVWRIERPTVTQPQTAYPAIHFNKGDLLIGVAAGGCVNTGGLGDGWKHFVHPQGSNADRMYWGTIGIPGRGTPIKLAHAILGVKPESPEPADASGPLVIGYVDDDYHDNEYGVPGAGNNGQCVGQGNAWVEVTIRRKA